MTNDAAADLCSYSPAAGAAVAGAAAGGSERRHCCSSKRHQAEAAHATDAAAAEPAYATDGLVAAAAAAMDALVSDALVIVGHELQVFAAAAAAAAAASTRRRSCSWLFALRRSHTKPRTTARMVIKLMSQSSGTD
eukprot:scpid39667/ scgid20840/ 